MHPLLWRQIYLIGLYNSHSNTDELHPRNPMFSVWIDRHHNIATPLTKSDVAHAQWRKPTRNDKQTANLVIIHHIWMENQYFELRCNWLWTFPADDVFSVSRMRSTIYVETRVKGNVALSMTDHDTKFSYSVSNRRNLAEDATWEA